MDWSKHVVEEESSPGFSCVSLRIPDRNMYAVHFINVAGTLLVTGYYGRWTFCREFHPEAGEKVSEAYWIEKLQNNSTQNPLVFNIERTRKRLLEILREDVWDAYSIGAPDVTVLSRLETCSSHKVQDVVPDCPEDILEALEWLIDAKETLNEGHLVYMACMKNRPDHLCMELPEEFDTHPQLRVVFEAFDEICRRMKESSNS